MGERFLATYFSYYDASRTQGDASGILMCIGLYANEARWLRFERRWSRTLRKFDAPYLHMKEFNASRGAFEGWDKDQARRADFIAELHKVVQEHVVKVIYRGVALEHYH